MWVRWLCFLASISTMTLAGALRGPGQTRDHSPTEPGLTGLVVCAPHAEWGLCRKPAPPQKRESSACSKHDSSWPGAAVAHSRRKPTLGKTGILRVTGCGLSREFTLSANSGH